MARRGSTQTAAGAGGGGARATGSAGRGGRRTEQRLALRSRIVLRCAEGVDNNDVAAELGVDRTTVSKWRRRFLAQRLAGLSDAPRRVCRARCWTRRWRRSCAARWRRRRPTPRTGRRARWPPAAASRRLPWVALAGSWAPAASPRDVQDLHRPAVRGEGPRRGWAYLNPPERALVLCVDEQSQIQALDRSQPVLPILPGTPARMSHDYVRHGTTSLFAALDVASGQVIGQTYSRHRSREFKRFPDRIDAEGPGRPRRAPDRRQLRHPQHAHDPPLAAAPPALPAALRAQGLVLAQPRRTLVRRSSSPASSYAAACTPRSPTSKPTSAAGSSSGTTTRDPSSGPRPPTRSSPTSPDIASESPTRALANGPSGASPLRGGAELGREDSNLRSRDQNPLPCRLATPHSVCSI